MAAEKHLEPLVEAVAEAIHDHENWPGSWNDYGCWTVNTNEVHEALRGRARAALAAIPGFTPQERIRVTYRSGIGTYTLIGDHLAQILAGARELASGPVEVLKVERQAFAIVETPWVSDPVQKIGPSNG